MEIAGTTRIQELLTTTNEVGRYWLEVLPDASVAQPMRVAGAVPTRFWGPIQIPFRIGADGYLISLVQQKESAHGVSDRQASVGFQG